jgi:hypothetical protein
VLIRGQRCLRNPRNPRFMSSALRRNRSSLGS